MEQVHTVKDIKGTHLVIWFQNILKNFNISIMERLQILVPHILFVFTQFFFLKTKIEGHPLSFRFLINCNDINLLLIRVNVYTPGFELQIQHVNDLEVFQTCEYDSIRCIILFAFCMKTD